MNVIKIGEPIITKKGTVITRYIENGRLYKSIDFLNSANKNAKQKGLVQTVVRYGGGNKPESVFDTFERKIQRVEPEQAEVFVSKSKRGRKKGSTNKKKTEPATTPKKDSPKPEAPKSKTVTPPKKAPNPTTPAPKPVTANVKPSGTNLVGYTSVVPVQPELLTLNTSKEMVTQIRKYAKLIGNNGSFSKDIKIMKEGGVNNNDSDVFLSIKREAENLHLNLYREGCNQKKNETVLDILVNKDGQMIEGSCPHKHLSFERRGSNIRRIKCYGRQYLPVSGNDRAWSCMGGGMIDRSENLIGKSESTLCGAYEVFLELARLYTSILK